MNVLAIAATLADFQLNDCQTASIVPGAIIRSAQRYAIVITVEHSASTTLADGTKIDELLCYVSDTARDGTYGPINVYVSARWCEGKWCML